ncbi:hypothetical protein [Coprobacillus sp. AF33-1AC]|uniref:hypothetical protein n=1 Tax=Coprobacillus sp. AF33-1AC TaxID=2292032 RepID=UPI000E4D6D71|nr:hypothetical protein [Coprobacillus sp. AF33-1AC]RHM62801.1 hypothetical protein DWZ53_01900 [Coprobacillus sp. AF33-1AC]
MFYDDFFQKCHTKELDNFIHEDDILLFKSNNIAVLYYFFPLIERLAIELLDLTSLVNIEHKDQGTIRTVNSLLHQEKTKEILGNSLIKKLEKYFKDDGIRNKIMHYNNDINKIQIDKEDMQIIKYITIQLASLYEEELKKIDSIKIERIDLIKK